MTKIEEQDLTFDEYDERINPRPEECEFDRIVEAAISRRGMLGVLGFGSFAMLAGTSITKAALASTSRFAFDPIPTNTDDAVTVPEGYRAEVLIRWGDPLASDGAEFDHATRGTAASQEVAFGDNTDGMEVFAHEGRLILAVNNEYSNRKIIWGNRPEGKPETDDDILKCKMAHGLSVVEIANTDGAWGVVKDSPYNRRVTPDTEMTITGPAAGHDLVKTAADPDGVRCLGTWNNCGNGSTPWGTYLACEENFNGYYSSSGIPIMPSPTSRSATASPPRTGAIAGRRWTNDSTSPSTPTSPIATAMWWNSIRVIPPRHRRSERHSAASSMRTPSW